MKNLIFPIVLLVLTLGGLPVGATPAATEAPAKRVVFFGDSLTSGYGIDPAEAYPALIQEKIDQRGWNMQSVNAGLSGETSAGGLRRIDWILRQPVDVFVLELGANDGLRGLQPTATKENLQGIIDRVNRRYPDAKVVLAGMQMPPNMGRSYQEEFSAIFPRLANANQAALIPFFLEGVGGVAELNLPDGVHPTGQGHRIIAQTVWETIEPLLRELTES
jgi:acyl-CoA thioesterase-1